MYYNVVDVNIIYLYFIYMSKSYVIINIYLYRYINIYIYIIDNIYYI